MGAAFPLMCDWLSWHLALLSWYLALAKMAATTFLPGFLIQQNLALKGKEKKEDFPAIV